MKVMNHPAKNLPFLELYEGYKTIKELQELDSNLSVLDAKRESLDCENLSDMNLRKCLNISMDQPNKINTLVKKKRGF